MLLVSKKKFIFLILYLFLPFICLSNQPTLDTPETTLSQRQLCDLELLINGGFAPLKGFMDKATYDSVIHKMRLLDGSLWPMPIILDINHEVLNNIKEASTIALKDSEGTILAYLAISEIWQPNKQLEAELVYGTTSEEHPGVDFLYNQTGDYYVAGKIIPLQLPKHYDFNELRKTPAELKAFFKKQGYQNIVAFQTRNPLHRAHLELISKAAKQVNGHVLLHPSVGMTKPGDVDYFIRVKCYKKLLPYYDDSITLSLLPLSMRMAGPKEALWHAIIRKNYGATHFIIGRDHAGPGKDSSGKDFYPPYAAQELAKEFESELGITLILSKELVYVKEDENYQEIDRVDSKKTILSISGTHLRKILREGLNVPDWFTYPEIMQELRKAYPPREKQGFTIFFTGLSGAGKSTLANALAIKLTEIQNRPVTLLDGDHVRKQLSSELGFSKEHRSLNVRRIGFVANEITKNHGIAICALIAPYEEDRNFNRRLINEKGNYIEVHVSTPLEECQRRDPKGLYEKARKGLITNFTGLDDPYEIPENPDFVINTQLTTVHDAIDMIINYLIEKRFFNP